MRCWRRAQKRFFRTSIWPSLRRRRWIYRISTSMERSWRPTPTSIPGYGRRRRRNPVTGCLQKSRLCWTKSTRSSAGTVCVWKPTRSMCRNIWPKCWPPTRSFISWMKPALCMAKDAAKRSGSAITSAFRHICASWRNTVRS